MSRYQTVKQVSTLKTDIRGLTYAVHTWGDPDATPVFLLHGLLDTGMSFQFIADAMTDEWYLIAPDWRGFGESEWNRQGYWFPDYLADLDTLIDHYSQALPVRLVGHSMGGNIACLYAGIQSERVSHLVSLDAVGLHDTDPAVAPARYRTWLAQLKQLQAFSHYSELEQLTAHIDKLAPGISKARARFIAETWSKPVDGGGYTVKADPAHRRVIPVLYRRQEARSCWKNISARTLFIFGEQSRFYRSYHEHAYQQDCQECFRHLSEQSVAEAGHMLHWQQPEKLAGILQSFLRTEVQ